MENFCHWIRIVLMPIIPFWRKYNSPLLHLIDCIGNIYFVMGNCEVSFFTIFKNVCFFAMFTIESSVQVLYATRLESCGSTIFHHWKRTEKTLEREGRPENFGLGFKEQTRNFNFQTPVRNKRVLCFCVGVCNSLPRVSSRRSQKNSFPERYIRRWVRVRRWAKTVRWIWRSVFIL